jgi:hypothetical protein
MHDHLLLGATVVVLSKQGHLAVPNLYVCFLVMPLMQHQWWCSIA